MPSDEPLPPPQNDPPPPGPAPEEAIQPESPGDAPVRFDLPASPERSAADAPPPASSEEIIPLVRPAPYARNEEFTPQIQPAPWPALDEEPPVPRALKPRPPQPGLLLALACFLGFVLVQIAVAAVILVPWLLIEIFVRKRQNPDPNEIMTPILAVTTFVCLAGSILVIRLVVGKDWPRQLAVRAPSVSHVLLALVALPALMVVAQVVHILASQVLWSFNYQGMVDKMIKGWPLWFGVGFVGLGAGLLEELYFRGFLGRGLVGHYGFIGGILFTSLLFGAAHMDPPHIVATAFMGFVLHYIYIMSRSLWLPIMLHALNNSLGVLSSQFEEFLKPYLEPLMATSIVGATVATLGGVFLLVAAGWAMYQSRVGIAWTGEGDALSWKPGYPGVEFPPPGSNSVVVRPWPGWLASGLVLLAIAWFAASIYTAFMLA